MLGSFKHYIYLVRLPNIFTTPSNILVGYFSVVGPSDANLLHVSTLLASSGLLYAYGIVLNDYFDAKVDLRERPSRPIPSGKVSKRNASYFAVISLIVANLLALLVGIPSFAVSIVLSIMIFAYDYRLKHSILGPLAMGTARFLNVFLGASPVLFHIQSGFVPSNTIIAASSMLAYVYSISLLSRVEAGERNKKAYVSALWQSFTIIFSVIAVCILLAYYLDAEEMLVGIALFSVAVYMAFREARGAESKRVQNAVKNLVLAIVLLDSVFIMAFAGLYQGLLVLVLVAPAILLSRKLYVT